VGLIRQRLFFVAGIFVPCCFWFLVKSQVRWTASRRPPQRQYPAKSTQGETPAVETVEKVGKYTAFG